MFSSLSRNWNAVNRRQLFRNGGLLTLLGAARSAPIAAAPAAPSPESVKTFEQSGAIYRAIGVRPVVNARGTFTIITGSQSLPSVKQAMEEASRSYVQMDELMEGVSARLAEITGAPWGIVTAGCCAALTHTTSACIAGTNPERMQRLPNLTGLKNEVIIPEYSRNVYDHAIRMVGTKIVTVHTPEELEKLSTIAPPWPTFSPAPAMKAHSVPPSWPKPASVTMSRSLLTPPPKSSLFPTFISSVAPRQSPIAAVNAFAVHKPPVSCSAIRIC